MLWHFQMLLESCLGNRRLWLWIVFRNSLMPRFIYFLLFVFWQKQDHNKVADDLLTNYTVRTLSSTMILPCSDACFLGAFHTQGLKVEYIHAQASFLKEKLSEGHCFLEQRLDIGVTKKVYLMGILVKIIAAICQYFNLKWWKWFSFFPQDSMQCLPSCSCQ